MIKGNEFVRSETLVDCLLKDYGANWPGRLAKGKVAEDAIQSGLATR